jgi:hypothetical protein
MTAATAPAAAAAAFDRDALDQLIAADSLPGWVADKRRAAFDAFAGLALPDRRSENWMRTDLRLFKPKAWGLRPRAAATAVPAGLLAEAITSGVVTEETFLDQPRQAAADTSLAGRLVSLDGHVIRAIRRS